MHLSEIWIYPVKSLGGIRLAEAVVQEEGLQYDRRWMVVDRAGKFLTQRLHPEMARIITSLRESELILSDRNNLEDCLKIPLDGMGNSNIQVQVWKDIVNARDVGVEVDAWLSQKLNKDVRLVKLANPGSRLMRAEDSVTPSGLSFADDFPYLLTATGSLENLNERLDKPIDMSRFRPNFVIAGTLPFQEDNWTHIRIGNIHFAVAKPCERCVVINVDQTTGVRSAEPLKTLASYRKVNRKILFGQNLIARNDGVLKTGDLFTVIGEL
jgi:uncharacterized protein YcbX